MKSEKSEKVCKQKLSAAQRISNKLSKRCINDNKTKDANNDKTDDSDSDLFEIEESDAPLIPLYHLRDEGSIKWVLITDLCNLLKVKSKDTLLKQVRIISNYMIIFVIYFK